MDNCLLNPDARVMRFNNPPSFLQEHLLSIQDFFLKSTFIQIRRIATNYWVKYYNFSSFRYYQVRFPECFLVLELRLFKGGIAFPFHA